MATATAVSPSQPPAISVIIATRNRAHYLSDCLASVASQRCTDSFEVVVVDNGSTDGTPAIIDEWCAREPRLRLVREEVAGLSRAKNAGIQHARGELLVFTDDDIIAQPGWLQTYRDFYERKRGELLIAGGPIVPVPHDLGAWPLWFEETAALPDIHLLDYGSDRVLEPPDYVWGANLAIPTTLFQRYGLWDEALGVRGDQRGTYEDTELQDRIRAAGEAVWFCRDAAVHHRVPRQTITPARVLGAAFTHGRNAFWRPALKEGGVQWAPRRSFVPGLIALVWQLAWLAAWTIAFRFTQGRRVFERARGTARAAGHTFDSLLPGRESSKMTRFVRRLAFRLRTEVLRLVEIAR